MRSEIGDDEKTRSEIGDGRDRIFDLSMFGSRFGKRDKNETVKDQTMLEMFGLDIIDH